MCGICGVYLYQNGGGVDETIVERMTEMMAHRGPDDSGTYFSHDRKIGLGHRRLSIVDLGGGHQPMSNEDGTVWIVFNGEIYNHGDIRGRMEERGHVYRTQSDTETIIHLYEECGMSCVEQLDGMFAFCLWDEKNRRILLARDRAGEKPLYYADLNGTMVFASEIKSILAVPWIEKEVDLRSLYHYLTFLVSPAGVTLFKGIRKLEAGRFLVCEENKGIKSGEYWDAIVHGDPQSGKIDERYYIGQIRSLLRNSIKARMMSDVPFGVFLSGGIDSSLNVALMSEVCGKAVNTFTVAYEGDECEEFNELQYAHQVSSMFHTNHHEVMLGESKVIEFLPELIYHQDEPIADPVCVPLYYVSKLARDNGVYVVQIGEGSDELFAGYERYFSMVRLDKRMELYRRLPNTFQKAILGGLSSPMGLFIGKRRREVITEVLRRAALDRLFMGGAILFSDEQKKKLLSKHIMDVTLGESSLAILSSTYDRIERAKPSADLLEKMIYLELKQRLPELLLMRVDKMTMAASIEGRAPFLDHKLIEFAMGIPMEMKIKSQPKYILKKAAEGIIPGNIIYRRKRGFPGPVNKWLKGKLGRCMRETFKRNGVLKQRDWLNYDVINQMLDLSVGGKGDFDRPLWGIFNFALWYDYWFEGKEIGFEN